MKIRMGIVCLLLVAFLLPSEGLAFDKQRKGFVLGLGAGYGSAKLKFGDASGSYSGFATTFKIGHGVSENVVIDYRNPTGPSFYFTGELGFGVIDASESGRESPTWRRGPIGGTRRSSTSTGGACLEDC